VPETPEELFARAAGALRMPPVQTWETFPFEGQLRPRPLQPPLPHEKQRSGANGVDCSACTDPDDDYFWRNERWRLRPQEEPNGLPVVLRLEPRAHLTEPGDLSDELASELGVLIARIERAVRSVPGIGRVHVCRWNDGSEHLHWWFMGRPARMAQLVGSFAMVWDDVLPPVPEAIWRENVATVAAALQV
jgi:diadenosine tetraphosphate (Ap4A) HIT family hydrolase